MSRTRIDPSLLNNLSSNLNMGSNKIVSLANGTTSGDATAFGQVQYAFQNAVQSVNTTSTTTSSTTFVATSTTASIAPTSASNRIKITITGTFSQTGAANAGVATIFRNSSDLSNGNGFATVVASASITVPVSITYIDSPSTTSSITYAVYIKTSGGSAIWNNGTGSAVITLEELR